ncbi:MAG TPA: hypothetical protein VGS11_11050 [Candidatus Bathyarchaeia archaeon]|nr:hypothetical protein [Candidatus Bathyarchaeia archaeon]
MKKGCPHCGSSVSESWHESHGLERIDRGWVQAGIPIVGRVKIERQVVAVVYVCLKTNLPFLVALPFAK